MISKNTNNNLQFAILSPNDEAQISKGSEGFGSEWCKMLSNYSYIYLVSMTLPLLFEVFTATYVGDMLLN